MVDSSQEAFLMSVTAQPGPPAAAEDPAIPTEPIYRLSVAQYHAMARHGILDDDAPVELLEGWLVQKMTKHPPHSIATRRTRRALESLLPAEWYADSQEPITLSHSEPEPDVLVARAEVANDPDRHPGPRDVGLVVEVADSTLRRDRSTKKRVYAGARIPVYWIVNLIDCRIEVYTDPTGPPARPDYREQQNYGPEERIPVVLGGVEIGRLPVRDLLP
jgi:Putative restriction endonuclease